MDVDMTDAPNVPSGKQAGLPVDDAHPFDLEGYISNYTGRAAIYRLVHIISNCPALAPDAFSLVVQHIHQSREPQLYQQALNAYEHAAANSDVPLPNPTEIATLDAKWIDEINSKNAAERVKLEVELKSYTNNMIKESIRMAHRDLGNFYRSAGDPAQALKHFTKSREYCATGQHVLEMCLSVLELLIEQRNYTHLPTYVFKAETALDAAVAQEKSASSNPTAPAGASKKGSADRDRIQSKLDFAQALANLGQGYYDKAAFHFLRIGPSKDLDDWLGTLIAPSDIAIYGTLCALSSYSRSAIKAQILENSVFGAYIEQEPYVRELIEAYMGSKFKIVLELLSRYSTRHALDIHLHPHASALTTSIRNWAVKLYFQPFQSIKLDRMSAAFGWSVEEVERQVVRLIQNGEISARVDSQNKILLAKKTDYRADLFERAMKAGNDIQEANRKVLLRMRFQQADLVIKAPKGHASQQQQLDMAMFTQDA
ncbi:G protein pathway suppressor 1 [Schizophyllum amplum]|uniref:G protein pathway suppressor 1 n=1 Tax=Schizophyllum amplum TaxID=97359 RepID=A0A550CQT1_9AGAR|nr:G protein pathway suppressor 1 [Auriculariopsis ampla]